MVIPTRGPKHLGNRNTEISRLITTGIIALIRQQGTVSWATRQADALLIIVDLSQNPLSQMEDIKSQLEKMRILIGNAEANADDEDTIFWAKKALIAGNKADLDNGSNFRLLVKNYGGIAPVLAISSAEGTGLDELRQEVYKTLDIIRVYTKAPGKKAEMNDPVVLPAGSTLKDAAASVHKDFANNLKFARIWGSGKHDGVMAKRDHILADGDVIELHL